MKQIILMLLLVMPSLSFSQEKGAATTFILIRHAEKSNDGSKDPDLSEIGKTRAQALAAMLKNVEVKGIYSTPYKRTKNTVQSLATLKSLSIQTYEPLKPEVIDTLLKQHQGETIIVVGHSNTIPWMVNQLLGEEKYTQWTDDEYTNMLIVTMLSKGKVASVTWLNYCP